MEIRNENFTASELGQFALDPVRVTLTVDQIKVELDKWEIPRKGLTKREDLLAKLPDHGRYSSLCDGARTAIIKKIVAGQTKDAWQIQMDDKREKQFENMIPIQRGNYLEPQARELYERLTGYCVTQVGFIEHDSGGFGCSPDGLIRGRVWKKKRGRLRFRNRAIKHGLEIKCPMPETHIDWLLDGVLPECHSLQCHAGMAVTGLDRWDFLSYCPGDAPLLIEVYRDETTEKLEAGLKVMVAEKAKMLARLSALAAKAGGIA